MNIFCLKTVNPVLNFEIDSRGTKLYSIYAKMRRSKIVLKNS